MGKKVLIIGGNSSICDEVIINLEKVGFQIDLMTYRNEENKKNIKDFSRYNWKHLDLRDKKSTEDFILELKENYYDVIWCVPTYQAGGRDPMDTPRDFLEDLYGNFIVNYIDLIRNLAFKALKDEGRMIYQSSESANVPTDMQDYSAAKATIQAYVRSLAKKIKNKAIFTIATTGIYDSRAYHDHGGAEYYKLDPGRWVQKKEISELIRFSDLQDNGKVFTLGFCPMKTDIVSRHAGIIYPYNFFAWSEGTWYGRTDLNFGAKDVLSNHEKP